MNTLILTVCGGVIFTCVAKLIIHHYNVRNDVTVCSKCAYSNSICCWDCRRKYDIAPNRYNNKHMMK